MKKKNLTEVFAELKMKYDPTSPTAYSDGATFTQLDMNIVSLHSRVKFWEMDPQLYRPVDSSNSKLEDLVIQDLRKRNQTPKFKN